MKKLALFFVAVLFSACTFAQGLVKAYDYKNANSKFSKQIDKGSFVYLTDSSTMYLLKDVGGSRNTLNGMIDSSDVNSILQWTYGTTPTISTVNISTAVMASGDTTTATVGAIVYIAADSSFYGCRSTVAAQKWYKLN
jgi:hypothetical protein